MADIENDLEAHRFANSVIILVSSFLILAIILRFVIGNNLWTPLIAFSCGIALCLGYYVRVTLKNTKKNKEENNQRKIEVEGS